jgi:magnesium-transporting ATPase (P-type)
MDTLKLAQVIDSYPKQATRMGLSKDEVLERRAEYGENRLPSEKGVSAWTILFNQLKSPLVYIILAAAGISLALGEFSDFAIIMAVVVIDVILGFVQEYQAQKTYVALKGLLKPTTTVLRNGQRLEVEVWELVPGDLVVLNAGEKAPGDGELLEATKLSADEAILTGECEPVTKQAINPDEEMISENGAGPQTQVFMGTTMVTGRGILRISKTGTKTELGQIAASLSEHVEEETPLQVRLKSFSKVLTYIVVTATLVILVVGLLMGSEFFALPLFRHFFQMHNNPVEGRSIVFASFAINSIVYIFAYRSMRLPLYRMNKLTANKPLIWAVAAGFLTIAVAFLIPGLRELLGIVPLTLQEWSWVIGVGLILLVLVEIAKAVSSRLHPYD